MKINTFIQNYNKEIQTSEIEKRIKDLWKEQGKMVKDLDIIDIYIKVEENTCYYVINNEETGSFTI